MFKFPIWMPSGIMDQWRCDCPFCKLGNLYKEGRDHSRLVMKPTNECFWKLAVYFHFKSICIFKSRLFYIHKGTICKGPLPGTEYSYTHLNNILKTNIFLWIFRGGAYLWRYTWPWSRWYQAFCPSLSPWRLGRVQLQRSIYNDWTQIYHVY